MMPDELTIFLAGDTMLVEPWSVAPKAESQRLFEQMRNADVTIVNLETILHDFEGFAQATSGGTWMRSPPRIADELAWAGVDMVAHANNHAFDYGPEAIITTHKYIEAADIRITGSGADLHRARQPSSKTFGKRRVGHYSVASTYVPYGRGSRSSPALRGRPGVNPLGLIHADLITLTPRMVSTIRFVDRLLGKDIGRYDNRIFRKNGRYMQVGESIRYQKQPFADLRDEVENLQAIELAKRDLDVLVVTIHAHLHGAWLTEFAHAAIDRGADVIVVDGPHEIRGIEIYRSRPIFYCLGNFAYQPDRVPVLPKDAYYAAGLNDDAGMDAWVLATPGIKRLRSRIQTYQGLGALVKFDANMDVSIELIPLDLGFHDKNSHKGVPRIADRQLGNALIESAVKQSARYATRITYDGHINRGVVRCK